jgi:hypothetical protein
MGMRHTRTLLAVLTVFFSVIGIVVFSLFTQTASRSNLVSFSCRAPSSSEIFTIAVDINLTDGMNKDEALAVANQVYFNAFAEPGQRELRSARQDENGSWTIEYVCQVNLCKPGCNTNRLYYGNNGVTGHIITTIFYTFVINPFDQTVIYSG